MDESRLKDEVIARLSGELERLINLFIERK